ncbi:MAG: hypothetical protein WB778_02585 [Thermoplasmata archaeon]
MTHSRPDPSNEPNRSLLKPSNAYQVLPADQRDRETLVRADLIDEIAEVRIELDPPGRRLERFEWAIGSSMSLSTLTGSEEKE